MVDEGEESEFLICFARKRMKFPQREGKETQIWMLVFKVLRAERLIESHRKLEKRNHKRLGKRGGWLC